MTTVLQVEQIGPHHYLADTPGLSDTRLREKAAQEIEASLRRGGYFRLVFVITLEAGRVRPDDATTISLVLEAVKKEIPFAILINKLAVDELSVLEEENNQKDILTSVLSGTNRVTPYFEALLFDVSLAGKENAIPSVSQIAKLAEFLKGVPFMKISPSDVSAIASDFQEERKEQMEGEIARLKEDKHYLERMWQEKLEAASAEHKGQLEDFKEDAELRLAALKKEQKDMEKRFDDLMKYANDNEKLKQIQAEQEIKMKDLQEQIRKNLQSRPPPAPIVIGGCFGSNDMVRLKSGKSVKVRDLNIGDLVESVSKNGERTFSAVFWNENLRTNQAMLKISHSDGFVELTEDHLIFSRTNNKSRKPVMAKQVREGDFVFVMSFEGRLMSTKVTKIERFDVISECNNCLVMNDCMIANGILCSSYSCYHRWESIECLDMKILYHIAPSVLKSEKYKKLQDKWDGFFDKIRHACVRKKK